MADAPGRPVIAVTGPSRSALASRLCVQLAVWLACGHSCYVSPKSPASDLPYHGVIVTGGNDIDPVLYAEKSEVQPRYDPERDAFESRIIDDALARDLPLLGICRGAQLLNVRLGGSLFQELKSRRRRTSHRWTVLPLKTLVLERDTSLGDLLSSERVRINHLHNQGIDRLGEGLRVSARDLDEIVQAVEDPRRLGLMGVQWHPEYLLYLSRQRRLFRWLVSAARQRANGKV